MWIDRSENYQRLEAPARCGYSGTNSDGKYIARVSVKLRQGRKTNGSRRRLCNASRGMLIIIHLLYSYFIPILEDHDLLVQLINIDLKILLIMDCGLCKDHKRDSFTYAILCCPFHSCSPRTLNTASESAAIRSAHASYNGLISRT